MTLSRLAREFAAEINKHDWSDAPFRADRAGHHHSDNPDAEGAPQLDRSQTGNVRKNVMWVTAQVLAYSDPNFNVFEFAEACGVESPALAGDPDGVIISSGLRIDHKTGEYERPGGLPTWDEAGEEDEDLFRRRLDGTNPTGRRVQDLWPNARTPGFVTPGSRNVHRTTWCMKYQHAESVARERGRAVPEPVWTTTGQAREAGKGICLHCWTA